MPFPFARSFCVVISLLSSVAASRAGDFVEEVHRIPVKVKDFSGAPVAGTIDVTVFRDPGRTAAPVVILNHGREATENGRTTMQRPRYTANARYLVDLGFVVFLPFRLGYGPAGDPDVEFSGACETKNYPPAYEAGLEQTRATLAFARTQSYADMSRVLIMGQSFGGAIAVAATGLAEPGLKATVNFAGGGGGNPVTMPGKPCRPDLLKAMFASYGKRSRVPSLWFYSDNDQFMGYEHPRQWFEAYRAAGGKGEFASLPAFGKDGHGSFSTNPSAWKPAFERFLKANGYELRTP